MDHTEREHAPFSPSAAERWLNCPASVRYAEKSAATQYTDFGTRCHELAEQCLRGGYDEATLQAAAAEAAKGWITQWRVIEEPLGDVAMRIVEVVRPYVDYVNLHTVEGCTRRLEERVTIAGKDCWGSLDCSIYTTFDTLRIIDLKGGSGKCVNAEENTQLLTYAVGEAERYNWAFEKAVLVIVQPARIDGRPIVDEWECTPDVIRKHQKRIKAAIKAAQSVKARPVAGDWCEWCPARALCPAQRKQALACLGEDPSEKQILTLPDAAALTPEQLSRVLQHRKAIEKWLEACSAFALTQPPPGWKVVEGGSKRRWALEPDALSDALRMEGVDADMFLTRKPIGVTEAEKLFKKLNRADLIDTVFEKPPGKPMIATIDDPRPALDPIRALPDLGGEA